MFEKVKRFVAWVMDGEVPLGKLWVITLTILVGATFLAVQFQSLPVEWGMLREITYGLIVLSYFFFLFALMATAARLFRWWKESPRVQLWFIGTIFAGLLGGFLFFTIVYPAEALAFFQAEWERMWADSVIRWLLTIAGWVIAACFSLVPLAAVASPIVKLMRKNRL